MNLIQAADKVPSGPLNFPRLKTTMQTNMEERNACMSAQIHRCCCVAIEFENKFEAVPTR